MYHLLRDTRLPTTPQIPGATWDYGVDLDWLKSMRNAWLNEYDWRVVERRMNTLNHFKVTIEGIDLHYLHHQSDREGAIPVILTHGWPGLHRPCPFAHPSDNQIIIGSFWEFHNIIPYLTSPPSSSDPAFHVVIPSLPGFTFSSPPPRKDWRMKDNARILNTLMITILGYSSYMAQGGDWGSLVTTILGTHEFAACKLINLNMTVSRPPPLSMLGLGLSLFLPTSLRMWLFSKIYSEDERRDFSRSWDFLKTGMGYYLQHLTRPFTIGYAIGDSPLGVLAWLGEKYYEHIDPDIYVQPSIKEDILTTVTLYYLTNSFATSAIPYKENASQFSEPPIVISKPYGLSRFPYDIFVMPVSWIRSAHRGWPWSKEGSECVFVRRHEHGGHFPGLEVPEDLANDLRAMAEQNRGLFE